MCSVEQEEATRQRVEAFLDEWHFRMVKAKVAKGTDRKQALRTALEVLELNGTPLPDKEAYIGGDPEVMIGYIVQCMPQSVQDNFEHITIGLCALLKEVTEARRVLDGQDNAAKVKELCKANEGLPMMNAILRHSILHASRETAWTMHSSASWRENTEKRIHRLTAASSTAEEAGRNLAKTEDRLRHCKPMLQQRARQSLARIFSVQDTAMLHKCVSAWHAIMLENREIRQARARFEQQLADLEDKLVLSKGKQIANIKAVLMRGAADEAEFLKRDTLETWAASVQELKKEREVARQMEALQAKLAEGQEAQAANAKKVLARMTGNNEQELRVQTFQAWLQFAEMSQEERKREQELQEAHEKMQKQLEGQKSGTKNVLASMSASTNSGLLSAVMQNWALQVQEEHRAREVERVIQASNHKFQTILANQAESAAQVQQRTSEAIESFCLLRCFSAWGTHVLAEHVQRKLAKKIESKRKQLDAVQQLFMTFARELDQGLDEGDTSARDEAYPQDVAKQKRMQAQPAGPGDGRKGGLRHQKGMHGSTSLPNIHHPRANFVR